MKTSSSTRFPILILYSTPPRIPNWVIETLRRGEVPFSPMMQWPETAGAGLEALHASLVPDGTVC